MFEKPLGEVAGVFMDCLVTLVIVLHGLCTMNGKTTYENLVNLLCGLVNSRSGSPIRFRMWTSRSPIHLSLTNPRHADRTRSEATCDAWRNCVCVCEVKFTWEMRPTVIFLIVALHVSRYYKRRWREEGHSSSYVLVTYLPKHMNHPMEDAIFDVIHL